MNIDYFRAAEREISSLPLLKKSLPIMRKRLERLIEAGAPKEPAGVDFSKPYVDSHHVNDTLGELCALVETKNEIYATEQKIHEIEEILEAVPEEQRTVLTLFYIEKLTAEQIAERIYVESEKTVYNIRNKGIATYSILCYGALARSSESGEIVTSRRVKAVYSRLVEEIQHPKENSPYYFDEELGERPIQFIERFCKQSQGTLGAPLKLELFQKAFIQTLFGFIEKETGFRRFRETLFLCGRKNGKSTLLSGIALYMLIADGEGAAEIYSVATKKDQAKKVLTEAVNMIKQSPELRAVIKKRRNDVYFPYTASIFEALASDSNTLDGLNAHGVIIDELHAIRDRNLYEVMKQSTSSRRQPLVVMITTAGTVRECIFDDMYKYACDVADGIIEDPLFLPILYELDAREEWTDPTKWIKANPGLGVIKQYKTLEAFVERAKKNPADLPGVLCKDFNVRENSSESWLSFEEINNTATFELSDVFNTYAIGGCDLSATTDLTAATLLIRKPGDETVYVLQQYFLPEARVEHLEEKNTNEAPYRTWAKRGLLTICPGNRVNYSDVTAWFMRMREEYRIDPVKIGYDRALAGYWVDEMKSNGFEMSQVAQGAFTWAQPMREMGAALGAHKVNYNNNPILKWCLSNTAVKKSGLNNIEPKKITDKRRIDGAVSLLNAWVVYVRDFENYMYFVG